MRAGTVEVATGSKPRMMMLSVYQAQCMMNLWRVWTEDLSASDVRSTAVLQCWILQATYL